MLIDSPVSFLSQGIDYLGFLNAKLRDLKGWATLANELVQNADDAKGATRVVFNVTDSALIVENDAQFSDCGAIEETRCGYDIAGDGKICCDFHAFRRVASGHKRQESNTTGAFGIGFISVYQITDQPKLSSGFWEWVLDPEALETRRIRVKRLNPPLPATKFEFPWALSQTNLRTHLGIEPISTDVVDQMCMELRKALTKAAPFLKQLETLELRRHGKVEWVVHCLRDPTADEIVVEAGGDTYLWKRLRGDFSQDAVTLRARYGASIETKRKTEVTVAVPIGARPKEGLLYASLPTEHSIALPVLINADFFPSSDRKRILFDQDYQGDWNRAAMGATARALAAALPILRDQLKPVDFWHILEQAKELHRTAESNAVDKVLGSYWENLAPAVRSGNYVRTTRGNWCSPVNVRLLPNAKDDAAVLPLLELLGLNLVHLDLQPFSNLLRDKEVGVGLLTINDLTEALLSGGYNRVIPLDQTADWLKPYENRDRLGQLVMRLLDRVGKEAKAEARVRATRCALVMTTGGTLAPACELRIASTVERSIFSRLAPEPYWAADNNPTDLAELVTRFSVNDVIKLLQRVGKDGLYLCYQADNNWISRVIGQLAENRPLFAINPEMKRAIRQLSIWPSGGELHPLEGLSVTGGFDDKLKLAKILDPDISNRWALFLLEDLGAQALDLQTYLIEHVPRAFQAADLPDADTRRALLQLLVDHSGKLLDNNQIAHALRKLPIVECQDGHFYTPLLTYFDNEVVHEVFGNDACLVKVPNEKPKASMDVLAWLGVSGVPRANDVLERIDKLTEEGPTNERRKAMCSLFQGLAANWDKLKDQQKHLEKLRHMKWLPGDRSMKWLQPSEVYSVFSRYLFETQAEFLDVPMPIQRSSASGLLHFLQIRSEPEVSLVVNHLLLCAQQEKNINKQVYEFLSRNKDAQAVARLKDQPCLHMSDNRYVKGTSCYWGAHPFGQYRIQLASEWREYQALLDRLGVCESPQPKDAISVLSQIAEIYANNRKLEELDQQVVMNCWTLLSEKPEDLTNLIPQLKGLKLVPNLNGFLRRPDDIFFDDRPGLVDKFDDALRSMVIRKPEVAWRAMQAAGVDFLSTAVKTDLVECVEAVPNEMIEGRLKERWSQVRRVFGTLPEKPARLSEASPAVYSSDRLTVSYRLHNYVGLTEDVQAYFTDDRFRIYASRGGVNHWASIARELAYGFHPDAAAGPLASVIKDILQARDEIEASKLLDDLGIADISLSETNPPIKDDLSLGMGNLESDQPDDDKTIFSTVEPTDEMDDPNSNPNSSGNFDANGATLSNFSRNSSLKGSGEPMEKSGGRGGTARVHERKSQPGRTVSNGGGFVGRSYVKPQGGDEDAGMTEEAIANRVRTDSNGVKFVLAYERQNGRFPTEMPHENEGYDVESRDISGKIVRYIEVKSVSGSWDAFGVNLSVPQFRMAQERRNLYWLYIVEKASKADSKMYRIQDPSSKVKEYRFDDGWQLVTEKDEAPQFQSILDSAVCVDSLPSTQNDCHIIDEGFLQGESS